MLPDPKTPQAPIHALKATVIEEDASQHLWAVSYADLLMVLMSFFIIYFQLEDVTQPEPDRKIASVETVVAPVKQQVVEKVVEPISPPAEDTKSNALELIAAKINENSRVWGSFEHETLSIQLSDDLFRVGQFELLGAEKEQLNAIYDLILPLIHGVRVVVVGHTDDTPIVKGFKSTLVDTNLVLATLRASKAAQLGMLKGIPPDRINAEAGGDSERKTRSLTLRIIADKREPASVQVKKGAGL